jgi:hypothetical protein
MEAILQNNPSLPLVVFTFNGTKRYLVHAAVIEKV